MDASDMAGDISDRVALTDLMTTFALGIDTCNWSLYRSVFTDEIELDYSSWRAGSIGRWSADDWVARAATLFPGFTATRHALGNMRFAVAGDIAEVRANVTAEHVIVEPDGNARVFTLNGYYDDRCVLASDGWRISGKRLVAQWSTGDPTVMDAARARALTDPQGRP